MAAQHQPVAGRFALHHGNRAEGSGGKCQVCLQFHRRVDQSRLHGNSGGHRRMRCGGGQFLAQDAALVQCERSGKGRERRRRRQRLLCGIALRQT